MGWVGRGTEHLTTKSHFLLSVPWQLVQFFIGRHISQYSGPSLRLGGSLITPMHTVLGVGMDFGSGGHRPKMCLVQARNVFGRQRGGGGEGREGWHMPPVPYPMLWCNLLCGLAGRRDTATISVSVLTKTGWLEHI